jgi:hypothetical protein
MPVTFTNSKTVTAYSFRELIAAGDDPTSPVKSKAVDKARQGLIERSTDHDWHEYTLDAWTKLLESVGFTGPKINYSGFWSQGDGASFTSGIDAETLIRFLSDPPPANQSWGGESQRELQAVVVNKTGGVYSDKRFARLLWIADHYDAIVKRTSSHCYHKRTCSIEGGFNLPDVESAYKDRYGYTLWVPKHTRLSKLVKAFEEAVEQLRLDLCHAIYKDLEDEYDYITGDEALADGADANDEYFDRYGNLVDKPPETDAAELTAWEEMC